MIKQGIILCGGEGTRLRPMTEHYNKALVPINGKFIIDFPLHTLLKLGVQDLIVVLGGSHFAQIVSYIKDGKALGFNSVSYVYQNEPTGISQAISLCENLIHDEQFAVILGDNVFEGDVNFDKSGRYGAQIVLHKSEELNRFGVASIDGDKIIKIEEKPKAIDANYVNYAITGLYLFDFHFWPYFHQSKRSDRNEFEITDIMHQYHKENALGYTVTHKLWRDAGTVASVQFLNDYFGKK